MDFKKFKQMATDHADFIAEIEKVSKEYCLINDIEYNPMDDYYTHEAYADDATTFEIDEDNIIIHYIWDIGTCGEIDWDHRSLRIPMTFFDPDNKDNEKLKAKQRIEEAKRIKQELSEMRSNFRRTTSELNEINHEKGIMRRNCEKYKIEFKSDEFDKTIEKLTKKAKEQEMKIDSLINRLKPYSDIVGGV